MQSFLHFGQPVLGFNLACLEPKLRQKEYLNTVLERLETLVTASISKDIHEFREVITPQISAFSDRVRNLERHVEGRAARSGEEEEPVP